jgi:Domain of unknown function (DUF4365)
MPKRPREHQLESESRTAFQRALGSGFVVRNINPDYGLDVEVEEFDAEGSATGLRIYAQLKATDETNVAKSLTVRLGASTHWAVTTATLLRSSSSRQPCSARRR